MARELRIAYPFSALVDLNEGELQGFGLRVLTFVTHLS